MKGSLTCNKLAFIKTSCRARSCSLSSLLFFFFFNTPAASPPFLHFPFHSLAFAIFLFHSFSLLPHSSPLLSLLPSCHVFGLSSPAIHPFLTMPFYYLLLVVIRWFDSFAYALFDDHRFQNRMTLRDSDSEKCIFVDSIFHCGHSKLMSIR